jgi:quinohemoprotein ethanol dehydrogenase
MAHCAICHSNLHRSISPDLRRMPAEAHAAFNEIVLRGGLLAGGMPRWDDPLSEADADAIHAYLIDLQAKTRATELDLKRQGKPLDTRGPLLMSSF